MGGRQCGGVFGQEPGRCGRVESGQRQVGQSGRLESVAGGDDQRGALGVEPPRGEQQGLGGRPVQPLRVVDEAQDGPAVGELGQQGQDGEADEHAVARFGRGEAEGPAQGTRLRGRERVGAVEGGPQQQVQAGERQVCLGLDRGAADDPHPVGRRRRVLHQRGLAHARLPGDEQTTAATGTAVRQQAVDDRYLVTPSVQHVVSVLKPAADPGPDCRGVTDSAPGHRP